MKELEINISDIKELMSVFSKNKMGSFELQQGQFSLKFESGKVEQAFIPMPAAAPAAVAIPEADEPAALQGNLVKSPIVGTFYASPSPDKKPYVTVGQKVSKGDVLFIIESMKLMNEVTSDFDGVVTQILVQNAQAVEYGQPILTIE